MLGTYDLNSIYQGIMIEHLVGQEILASQYQSLSSLNFWVREKKGSSAEVDYLFLYDGKIIQVEVKSGAEDKLTSLHLYMDPAPHKMAVRIYAGERKITNAITPTGKKYQLLNLPYYLVSELESYLNWFQNQF